MCPEHLIFPSFILTKLIFLLSHTFSRHTDFDLLKYQAIAKDIGFYFHLQHRLLAVTECHPFRTEVHLYTLCLNMSPT